MLRRLSAFALSRRRAVLTCALLLSLIGGAAGLTLFGRMSPGGFEATGSESDRATKALAKTFDQGPPNLVLLVTAPRGVDTPDVTRAGTALTARLGREAGVSNAASYWTSGRSPQLRGSHGDKALVVGTITGDETAVQHRARDILERYRTTWRGLHIKPGGYGVLQYELTEQTKKDATFGETLVFPVTLIALVLVFGSVVAAALPLIVALVTALLGMGVMWLLTTVTQLSIFSVNIVTLLGLGLAIDYSLLMVNRYREELRAGNPTGEAIRRTMGSAGRTVVFSALTVAVVLACLGWFPLLAVRSMAYAGVATAVLAALASLVVLPALLAAIGPGIDRGRLLGRRRDRAGTPKHDPAGRGDAPAADEAPPTAQVSGVGQADESHEAVGAAVSDGVPSARTAAAAEGVAGAAAGDGSGETGFWHRLATLVMRRPVPVATLVIAFMLLLGAPVLGLKLSLPDERVMPSTGVSRQVAEVVRAEFPTGEQNALQVVAPQANAGPEAITSYAKRLSALSGVARVDTVTGSFHSGTRTVPAGAQHRRFAARDAFYLSVVPGAGGAGGDPERLVRAVRAAPAPFSTLVAGPAATSVDATAALSGRLPAALITLAVLMVVLLFLLTGSVLLPFLAIVLSSLSITATFGALVWVFQDGHLAWLLGNFTVTGSVIATVPVMLFALSFGLAMDYQVFMLARIKEEYSLSGSGTAAVAQGLERIGRLVTTAALLISLVFLAFNFSGISFAKAFGVGLPLAVLMDATLVRGALLPATMRLAGRAAWWAPAALVRLHGRFGVRETEAGIPGLAAPAEGILCDTDS